MLIVADDLTGALDSAVAFAERGFSTMATVSTGVRCGAVVVAVNTDSRDAEESDARRQVRAAVANFPRRTCFKKIDTTLRGNLATELLELLGASGCKRAIIAPAFPATGRTTQGGVQFVRGRPVHEHYAANWTALSKPTSHLPTILAVGTGSRISSRSIEELEMSPSELAWTIEKDARPFIVFDAIHQAHLDRIAQAALLLQEPPLFCGAGGLALALAQNWKPSTPFERSSTQARLSHRPLLIVSGSFNPVTFQQLAHLRSQVPDLSMIQISVGDLLEGPAEEAIVQAQQYVANGKTTVLALSREPYQASAGRRPARALASAVRDICENTRPGGLLLTGGDVALAVCQALGANALHVVREFLPGMPLSIIENGIAADLPVISKAGGFGDLGALQDAVALWQTFGKFTSLD